MKPPAGSPHDPIMGILELTSRGEGALRNPARNYSPNATDPTLLTNLIRGMGLRGGEAILVRPGDGRPRRITKTDEILEVGGQKDRNGDAPPPFGELTVVDPVEAIRFETPGGPTSMRLIDLMAPIGKGQRALIVSPPRSGKTVLLKQMAHAIRANHPDALLMMLLVDERPEEVTEMRRAVCHDGIGWHKGFPEVVHSSNDQNAQSHLRIARLMIEKAKRCVEAGRDVIILLDSLTRLSRAFNASVGSSGRTMTGGLDIHAMAEPKAMFGAARKIEHGGSLTIIASVLVDTGSRMDDFIFQEFKGTGNMELVLDRNLANLRIWPAVDLEQSGTRKEELLLEKAIIPKLHRLRRRLMSMPENSRVTTLTAELEKYKSNRDFLAAMAD